ncbi:hypothetical protein L917_15251, partial [Phytophthora nicotianae]
MGHWQLRDLNTDYSFRSATILTSNGALVCTRNTVLNTDNTGTVLNCPGKSGADYY